MYQFEIILIVLIKEFLCGDENYFVDQTNLLPYDNPISIHNKSNSYLVHQKSLNLTFNLEFPINQS